MNSPRRALLAVLTLCTLATACGNPEAGDSCTPEGSLACESSTVALFCESGTLRAATCRGPGGCISDGERGTCDITRAVVGDACPTSVEAQAQCETGNANRALVCRTGKWTAQACNACAVQGGNVVCQP